MSESKKRNIIITWTISMMQENFIFTTVIHITSHYRTRERIQAIISFHIHWYVHKRCFSWKGGKQIITFFFFLVRTQSTTSSPPLDVIFTNSIFTYGSLKTEERIRSIFVKYNNNNLKGTTALSFSFSLEWRKRRSRKRRKKIENTYIFFIL